MGEAALAFELGDALDPGLNARVRALDAALARDPVAGVLEAVPTYRSLLVVFDPSRISREALAEALRARLAAPAAASPGRLHTIEVRYGGAEGPDLREVADATGLTEAEVMRRHGAGEYTAFMLGFLPGFAYLGLLPEALARPRRATPRPRIPAGSVAIAGRQTAVYPAASPGGWHLLGRTARRLFDPTADPPALLQPGDRVRFVATNAPVAEPAPAAGSAVAANPALEVLDGGWLTTVQDAGRRGLRRLGVGWSGPMDAAAHAAANRAVGNPPGAAALECTATGPRLRFLRAIRFAWMGADLGPVLEREDLGHWPVPPGRAVLARPGNVLGFLGRRSGWRAALAFEGGVEVPCVLGSRATDLTGGFGGLGGRGLRAGDLLGLGRSAGPAVEGRWTPPPSEVRLRVVPGPQGDDFSGTALETLFASAYTVTATSDRVGLRLEGPRLVHRGRGEIVTDGMLPGCIQVPPDGQPIVMAADGPTTGGYPKIATVLTADLDLLGQLVPGEGRVRFEPAPGEGLRRA